MSYPVMNMEYLELMSRADELEAPLADPPSTYPTAPCQLEMTTKSAETLAQSVDEMMIHLKLAADQRAKLATSLRNAAKAYDKTDEDAAKAVADGGSVSAEAPGSGGAGEGDQSTASSGGDALPPRRVSAAAATSVSSEPPAQYVDLETKAAQIEGVDPEGVSTDQGTAYTQFADDWLNYKKVLTPTVDPNTGTYRPFQYWTGDSASAVEKNMRDTRTWMINVMDQCAKLADQAKAIVSAHKVARTEHPSHHYITVLDAQLADIAKYGEKHYKKSTVMAAYADAQKQSDDALKKYEQNAGLTISRVSLSEPPAATPISPPDPTPTPTPTPTPVDPTTPILPSAPTTPMTPQPEQPDMSGLEDSLANLSSTGSGMKPASVGGGGGMPSTPLQPAVSSDAVPRPAAGPGAGLGRSIPGLGGAMGGPGMGMAPMGGAPGGAGQDNQTKRGQQEEEALYTEERSWTEGVIGSRRRKDVADSKDGK